MKPIRDMSSYGSVDFARMTDQLEMKLQSLINREIHDKIKIQLVWNLSITVGRQIYLDGRL